MTRAHAKQSVGSALGTREDATGGDVREADGGQAREEDGRGARARAGEGSVLFLVATEGVPLQRVLGRRVQIDEVEVEVSEDADGGRGLPSLATGDGQGRAKRRKTVNLQGVIGDQAPGGSGTIQLIESAANGVAQLQTTLLYDIDTSRQPVDALTVAAPSSHANPPEPGVFATFLGASSGALEVLI